MIPTRIIGGPKKEKRTIANGITKHVQVYLTDTGELMSVAEMSAAIGRSVHHIRTQMYRRGVYSGRVLALDKLPPGFPAGSKRMAKSEVTERKKDALAILSKPIGTWEAQQ